MSRAAHGPYKTGKLGPPMPGHIQEAFAFWYAADRDYQRTAQYAQVTETTVYSWHARHGWALRAASLDEEAEALARQQMVNRRAAMLTRHQQLGELLGVRGGEYLAANRIDNARDAIVAIKTGIEIERTTEGLPQWVERIINANDEELLERYNDLQQRLGVTGAGGIGGRAGPAGYLAEPAAVEPDGGGEGQV